MVAVTACAGEGLTTNAQLWFPTSQQQALDRFAAGGISDDEYEATGGYASRARVPWLRGRDEDRAYSNSYAPSHGPSMLRLSANALPCKAGFAVGGQGLWRP